MSKPKKKQRSFPFTEEQVSGTIQEYCRLSNLLQARRKFRTHFKTLALPNDVYGVMKNGLFLNGDPTNRKRCIGLR